jgi:hypothetical protein
MSTGAESQHAGKGNRQDKNIDGHQVKRKKPDGFVQVGFVDILHHHDLKLAGKKDDGHH